MQMTHPAEGKATESTAFVDFFFTVANQQFLQVPLNYILMKPTVFIFARVQCKVTALLKTEDEPFMLKY